MKSELITHKFFVMGGPAEIQIELSDSKKLAEVNETLKTIEAEARRLESKYSRYLPDSIISRINLSASSNQALEVDSETAALLDFAVSAFKASDKLFDISSGVLRRIWNFKTCYVPTEDEIANILPLIDLGKIKWTNPFIKLPRSGMELDLGGIVKEYACDRLIEIARSSGTDRALVNLAGDVCVYSKRDEIPWRVGIADPDFPTRALLHLELFNGACSTSGDYERSFVKNDIRYHHIFNPKNGKPGNHFRSVTCLAPSTTAAGVVSTTGMIGGEQALKNFGMPVICIRHDRSVLRMNT